MKKRIKRISIKQSAKVIAALYGIGAVVIAVPIGVFQMITNDIATGAVFLVLPVVYFFLIFLAAVVIFWLYNLVAKKFGGIEIELEDKTGEPTTTS